MDSHNPGGYQSPSQHELALNAVTLYNLVIAEQGGDEWTRYILVLEGLEGTYRDFVVARVDRPDQWEYVSDLEDRLVADLRWRLRTL